MKKIVTIVGARPQFIKVAPVSRQLRKDHTEILVNTGQHYDHNMAGIFFDELKIPRPDYDLGVGSSSHGKQTGQMIEKIEEVLLNEKADAVLVYGDTNSTLAGAIAASKLHIPIFHVEAGLRSFNRKMPEEINRVLTDHVSSLLFAPTETAVKNLEQEGIKQHVHHVGDVMNDAFLFNLKIAEENVDKQKLLPKQSFYLATIHRAENTDDQKRLQAIVESLCQLDKKILLPLHPRTAKKLEQYGLKKVLETSDIITMIEPVSYLEMILLEQEADGIITDSGGVQKEAYFASTPCFTLRDQTEWVETVEAGWNQLINPLTHNLSEAVKTFKTPQQRYQLYGNGNASELIVKRIKDFFQESSDSK